MEQQSSMSGKTPGQAAYEAYEAHYGQLTGDPAASWEAERDDNREAWEAAAAATADRAAELFVIVREMLAAYADRTLWSRCPEDDDRMDDWSKRAGLKAVVTAGADHLAAQILERRQPLSLGAQLAAALDERDDLRALVAEILDAADPDRGAEDRIAAWRQRAGLAAA